MGILLVLGGQWISVAGRLFVEKKIHSPRIRPADNALVDGIIEKLFPSVRPHRGRVAQLAEQLTLNQ